VEVTTSVALLIGKGEEDDWWDAFRHTALSVAGLASLLDVVVRRGLRDDGIHIRPIRVAHRPDDIARSTSI